MPAPAAAALDSTTGSPLSQRRPRWSSWTLAPPRGATIAFALYVLAAALIFGRPLLPHPGVNCLCIGTDEVLFQWGFAWYPHAILHGLNPFFSHAIYAPGGANVAQATMVPGPAIVMWPVTALFGPVVSFNVAETLAPALAAWTAFLLCRRVAAGPPVADHEAERERAYRAAFLPALAGGWLFGFSSYMLGQLLGHMQLTLVFLVPVLAHLLVRTYAGELGRVKAIVAFALCLLGLLSVGEEILATATLFVAVAFVAAVVAGDREMRARLRAMLVPVLGGYVVTAIVASPFLAYSLRSGGEPVSVDRSKVISADLLNAVVPTTLTGPFAQRFAATSAHFTGGVVESGAYLGVPLLVLLLGAGLVWGWRRAPYRVLSLVGIVSFVLALGPALHVKGAESIWLPWNIVAGAPLFGLILPGRLILYLWLVAAIAVALVMARARAPLTRVLAYGLAALSVAAIWPATTPFWRSVPDVPPLFASSEYTHVIARGQNVMIVPAGGNTFADLWQARAHFRFNLVGGYVLPEEAPNPYKGWPIYPTLIGGAAVPHAVAQARAFIAAHRVTMVLMPAANVPGSPWPSILQRLGWSVGRRDGVLIARPGR